MTSSEVRSEPRSDAAANRADNCRGELSPPLKGRRSLRRTGDGAADAKRGKGQGWHGKYDDEYDDDQYDGLDGGGGAIDGDDRRRDYDGTKYNDDDDDDDGAGEDRSVEYGEYGYDDEGSGWEYESENCRYDDDDDEGHEENNAGRDVAVAASDQSPRSSARRIQRDPPVEDEEEDEDHAAAAAAVELEEGNYPRRRQVDEEERGIDGPEGGSSDDDDMPLLEKNKFMHPDASRGEGGGGGRDEDDGVSSFVSSIFGYPLNSRSGSKSVSSIFGYPLNSRSGSESSSVGAGSSSGEGESGSGSGSGSGVDILAAVRDRTPGSAPSHSLAGARAAAPDWGFTPQGAGWGVDYVKSRLRRVDYVKSRLRREELRRKKRRSKRNVRRDRRGDDELDFLRPRSGGGNSVSLSGFTKGSIVFVLSFACAMFLGDWGFRYLRADPVDGGGNRNATAGTAVPPNGTSAREGGIFQPPSRWGNPNDEPPLTDAEKELDIEEWEDYEMEAASVLASARPGWDSHFSKGRESEPDPDPSVWQEYSDPSTGNSFYYDQLSGETQWERPLGKGVIILRHDKDGNAIDAEAAVEGSAGGNGEEDANDNNNNDGDSYDYNLARAEEKSVNVTDFDAESVFAIYRDSYWRWNHPFRITGSTDSWQGIDEPIFWSIPLSGGTALEEIFTHCYGMVVAGTTGASKDGKIVLSKSISEHLSIVTLDDGSHYVNIDMATPEGIEKAKHAGLGVSGVADVIITPFLSHSAELFRDNGHTGRCFAMLRHPVERAESVFHALKRKGLLTGLNLYEYLDGSDVEDNWMVRVLTNTMEGAISSEHLDVAKEVIGRKCLVGFTSRMEESVKRFAKFFQWENVHSMDNDKYLDKSKTKEECAKELVRRGVNKHNYARVPVDSPMKKMLRNKNRYDMELYRYALMLYEEQHIVFER